MTAERSGPAVVLITGATGPLGRAAARRFAADGAALALVGRDRARLEAVGQEAGAEAARLALVRADLRDRAAADAMAAEVEGRFGRVDILLHLVGGWTGGTAVVDLGADEVRLMLDQHLWTTLHTVAAVVPGMVARGFGRVIAVSSPLAVNPGPRGSAYAMAKAAEEALLRSLARELAGTGVTANLVAVRTIGAPGWTGVARGPGATLPEDIADTLAYLASPGASGISGQRIGIESRS